jgi:hypothetical protein
MRNPFSIIPLIPLGQTGSASQTIPLVRARTLSITVRLTFDAASDTDAVVNLYYSPDGNNWDTINFATFTIAHTASTTKQRTAIFDIPEHGYMWVKVYNGSQAKTFTNVIIWITIQSWPGVGAEISEEILKKEANKQIIEETGQLEL